MSNADGSCGCGRIDVHAHFLPECYTQALKKAGLTTLDGGFPVPAWSAQAALETMARQNIAASPYADLIEIKVGPALESIASLAGPFDMVFIDADKVSYLAYYEALLPKLAPNGVIMVDNVLWSGRLLDDADDSAPTQALR